MKRTALTTATAIGAAAALALGLTACGAGSSGGASTDTVDHLKIGNFLDVTAWDPANADIGFDGPYMSAVYDPLVRIDKDGSPQPALATKWEWSDDKKTLTLDLRDDVTFSDGEKFDADAAVANLEHLKAGAFSGEAYRQVESISKVDNDTIELALTERDDTLLYVMGCGRSWMASPKAIEADSLNKEPVGSGPYTLDVKKSTPGSEYKFAKVKDHWDAKKFPFADLTVMPFLDATARQNAMSAGQVNVIYADATNLPQAKQGNWNVSDSVGLWIGLQFTDRAGEIVPALADVRVRQAINFAFDGASILKSIGEGAGVATNQVFPAGGDINDSKLNDRYTQNVDKAKKLMAEAGYADGFSVSMPMSPVFQTWQAVTEQGLGSIGITVDWVDMQQPDYQTNAGTYPMFNFVGPLDSNAPTTVSRQIAANQWYNANAERDVAANPELAALVEKVQSSDGEAQASAIKELNEKVVDLAWFDVWYQAKNSYFAAQGIEVTPVTGLMFPTLDFIQQK